MQTGLRLGSGKSSAILAAAVSLALAAPLSAQHGPMGVIGVGAFGRLGSLPSAFSQGVPIAVEAGVQWPLWRFIHLATTADLTIQRMGTRTSFVTTGLDGLQQNHVVQRPYSFDVVHFGAGPAFAVSPTPRIVVSGALQGVALVPSWSSASVGTCGGTCAQLGPSVPGQQTELHWGSAARLRVTMGSRKEKLGFEIMGIAAPRHSRSRIPLSSLVFMVVVGAS